MREVHGKAFWLTQGRALLFCSGCWCGILYRSQRSSSSLVPMDFGSSSFPVLRSRSVRVERTRSANGIFLLLAIGAQFVPKCFFYFRNLRITFNWTSILWWRRVVSIYRLVSKQRRNGTTMAVMRSGQANRRVWIPPFCIYPLTLFFFHFNLTFMYATSRTRLLY